MDQNCRVVKTRDVAMNFVLLKPVQLLCLVMAGLSATIGVAVLRWRYNLKSED